MGLLLDVLHVSRLGVAHGAVQLVATVTGEFVERDGGPWRAAILVRHELFVQVLNGAGRALVADRLWRGVQPVLGDQEDSEFGGVAQGEGEVLELVVGQVESLQVLHLPQAVRQLSQRIVGQVYL